MLQVYLIHIFKQIKTFFNKNITKHELSHIIEPLNLLYNR